MANVILYSTGCPKCNVLKNKLHDKNISFSEVNDVQKMRLMNFVKVPVLEVDGKQMAFAEANDWINNQKGGSE